MSQRIVPGTDSIYLNDDGNLMVQDVNFQKFKAISMVCDNGVSFPNAPVAGQWFYRSDILTLYMYKTTWKAIASFGAVTLYVDGGLGSTSIEAGYASGGDSTLTIQQAINLLPPINGGNVVINIAPGTYNESLTIGGKAFSGNYTITFQGSLSTVASGTQTSTGTKGIDVTQGVCNVTGGFAGHADKLLYLSADGSVTSINANRVIDSVTADAATICGTFQTQPLNTEPYAIKDWEVIVSGATSLTLRPGQQGIILNDMAFTGSDYSLYMTRGFVTANRCKFATEVSVFSWSQLDAYNTLFKTTTGTNNIGVSQLSGFNSYKCKLSNATAGGRCIRAIKSSHLYLSEGTILDGIDKSTSNYGIAMETGAMSGWWSSAANGYPRVRHCNVGLYALQGGQGANTVNIQYLDNNTDELVDGTSLGYID